MKERRRSFGFWAAGVLVAGGVLYPLSFGPACWVESRLLFQPSYLSTANAYPTTLVTATKARYTLAVTFNSRLSIV
ncbi:MAG: hypothetical protein ACT4QC_09670 [Planctomycetaceae bacterium]